jgi:hypothetical protein
MGNDAEYTDSYKVYQRRSIQMLQRNMLLTLKLLDSHNIQFLLLSEPMYITMVVKLMN